MKLSVYLNFLYKHSFFGSYCNEFAKFIFSSEFNEKIYEASLYEDSYPETLKATTEDIKEVVSNNMNNLYNYFFKSNYSDFILSQKEQRLKLISDKYSKRLELSHGFSENIVGITHKTQISFSKNFKKSQTLNTNFERIFIYLSYFKEYDLKMIISIYNKLASYKTEIFEMLTDLENRLEVLIFPKDVRFMLAY